MASQKLVADSAAITVPEKFLGQHIRQWTGSAPTAAPTYGYGTARIHDVPGCNWKAIETSDNVFNWTTMDNVVNYFVGAGKEVFYQVWGTPQSAVGNLSHPWIAVPDQLGLYTSQVPNEAKLRRFVTALMTRYAGKIKYISPWNETKWGKPTCIVYGAITGTFTAGDHVTGQTTGSGATVKAVSGGQITVLYDNIISAQTPFANGEALWKDGSGGAIRIVQTGQTHIGYFQGSVSDAAMMQTATFEAAKSADSGVIVTTHDLEGGHSFENNWLDEFLTTGNRQFDMLSYHFYGYDNWSSGEYSAGHWFSLAYMVNKINATLTSYGLSSLPKIASECGYTQGWDFYDKLNAKDRADVIGRVSAMLAAYGYQACIWYSHESAFDGLPRDNPEVAAKLDYISKRVSGKTITDTRNHSSGNIALLVADAWLDF